MAGAVTVLGELAYVQLAEGGTVQLTAGQKVPSNADPEHVAHLTSRGVLGTDGPEKPPKVEDVLRDVGTDKVKAAAALGNEQALGDKARPSLVEKLEAVIAQRDTDT